MVTNIRLSPDKTYLQHKDGIPFFWLADTWWYGSTKRISLDEFTKLAQQRKKQGFTVIQLVVGIPPETDPFSSNAQNAGGFPFNKDWTVNKDYLDEVDKRIKILIQHDLIPCIVGGWGHHIDFIGVEKMKRFWDELIHRYGNLPVIFCLCGEANLIMPPTLTLLQSESTKEKLLGTLQSYHLLEFARKVKRKVFHYYVAQKGDALIKKRIQQWNEVGEYVGKKTNKLLTVHIQSNTTANSLFNNPSWLSIDSIQSGHDKDALPFMITSITTAEREKRPMINLEPWYEGIFNNFDAYYQRVAFWACILSGAKGHTYGAHGIWQMATEQDHFMAHWGKSDWEKATTYQGAEQVGKSVDLLQHYQWWKLEPRQKAIIPQWEEQQPYFPIVGSIEEKQLVIYVPNVSLIKATLTLSSRYKAAQAMLVLPDSLKQEKLTMKAQQIQIPQIKTKDALVIVELK